MLNPNDKGHNLSTKQFLTPLQKKILLFFAVNLPHNKNETVKAIKGNYRSSWDAFNELESKNLIKKVGTKVYRGVEYARFWLTENGVFLAMSERIKPDVLFRRVQEIYPENKDLQFLIEAIAILGDSACDMLYLAVITNGKIEQSDLVSIFASQKKLTQDDIKRYNTMLKKYPERYKQHKEYIQRTSKNLKDLSEMFDA